jgi:dTDP-4-amino-4,6-dideoxygalactose transaminase
MSEIAVHLQKSYDTNIFSNGGPCVKGLEEKLSAWIQTDAILMSNATIALRVVIEAMGLKGCDILVPSFTFAATACSIIDAGCRPVLVDCDPQTLMMSIQDAESKVTSSTRAMVIVQALGYCCDPSIFEDFAEKFGLSLIFDSAASLGASYKNGEKVGSAGDAEVFSLHITKTFGVGEGGLVTTKCPNIAKKCRQLINFGFDSDLTCQEVGTNAKMSEFHAAVGLSVFDKIESKLACREDISRFYRHHLKNVRFLQSSSAHQVFPVIFDSQKTRDLVAKELAAHGVGSRIYYKPLHIHPAFYDFVDGFYPNSQRIFETILCIPMWEGLSNRDLRDVVDLINSVTENS